MEAVYFSSPQQQMSISEGWASPLFLRAPSVGEGGLGEAACASQAGRSVLLERCPLTVVTEICHFGSKWARSA